MELSKHMDYGSIVAYEIDKLCKALDDKIRLYYDYCKKDNNNKLRLA